MGSLLAAQKVDAMARMLVICGDRVRWNGPHVQAQVVQALRPQVPLFSHRLRLVLMRAGVAADADAIGMCLVAVVRIVAGVCPPPGAPQVLKMACNWAL